MEKFENYESFELDLSETQIRRMIEFFNKKKMNEQSQNKFMEKLFIKYAEQKGYTRQHIEAMKQIVNSVDFGLTKSELIYKINSTTLLDKKIEQVKRKINGHLDENKKDVIVDKDTQKEITPLRFVFNFDLLAKCCLSTSNESSIIIFNELKQQALEQGLSQDDLNKSFNVVDFGPKANVKRKVFDKPMTLSDLIESETQNVIKNIASKAVSTNQVENIVKSGRITPETKLLVLCHLKEANDREFNHLTHLPEMTTFLGAETLSELIRARKKEKEMNSVLGSNKIKDPNIHRKFEENNAELKDEKNGENGENNIFSEYDKTIMNMLGIKPEDYDKMTPEEINQLAQESGIERTYTRRD